MEEKKSKDRKNALPPAESFASPDATGWLFRFIHEGWLRKRWKKRFCVLSNGVIYLYEQKESDGKEKTCSTVNLKYFRECLKASEKECKKNSNTLALEPFKKDDEGTKNAVDSPKKAKPIIRELFYTETPEELEKWISKIQESLSLANIGGNSKLTHITKTRARPPRGSGGNRRPPSKQHIKERAMMSEVNLEEEPTDKIENGSAKRRGQIPLNALRLPPGGKTSLKMVAKTPVQENGDSERHMSESSISSFSPSSPPTTPKPPSAALKPPSTKRVAAERSDSSGSANKERSIPLPLAERTKSDDDSVTLPLVKRTKRDDGSVTLPLVERTKSDDDSVTPPLVERTKSDDGSVTLPLVERTKSDDGSLKSSLPPSRTSSFGKKDDSESPATSSLSGTPPPTPPLSENYTNSDEVEQNENEITNGVEISPIKKEKLKNNAFKLELLNLNIMSGERLLKTRSLIMLDVDYEILPPPPSPPPEEINGGEHDNNNQILLKVKKKRKALNQRPASLVIDI